MIVAVSLRRVLLLSLLSFVLIGATAPENVFAQSRSRAGWREADRRNAVQAGERLEQTRHWLNAIEHYEDALKLWPENTRLKYGLRRSKIHFAIQRRYADGSFETKLLPKSRQEALLLFDDILSHIESYYVEDLSPTTVVAHGTESFYVALANEKFLRNNIPNADPSQIARLRKVLREHFWNKPVKNRSEARATVSEVCDLARRTLHLSSTPVVMEYVFGGCHAMDDYSNYLTPDRLEDLYGNIEGEFVGLGIEMKADPGKGLLLMNVLPDSPASEGGAYIGDYIVSINDVDCRNMSTDEAAKLLRGAVHSYVRLTLMSSENGSQRDRTFIRRPVQVKSIPLASIIDPRNGIGYIRMTGFQKTSVRELDAALNRLRQQGMRSLIWDLRGNPGGLLNVAAEVLDRFIAEGVLVSTRGRSQGQNQVFRSHRDGTSSIPLVLLVDGDSASASEIVAGAIRDHRRGIIVGRQTFGKWSVQSIFEVRDSTGLRMTTAKFYSPRGKTLGKIGVRPDIIVEKPDGEMAYYRARTELDLETDSDVKKALEVLQKQISQR